MNTELQEAIDAYLAAYPQGRNVLEARAFKDRLVNAARDDAAFAAARSINRPTAYQDYLDAFPSGAHVAQALAALDELVMRPGKRFRDCDSCPEMVVLAPGNFEQGSDESAPDARSSLSEFLGIKLPWWGRRNTNPLRQQNREASA